MLLYILYYIISQFISNSLFDSTNDILTKIPPPPLLMFELIFVVTAEIRKLKNHTNFVKVKIFASGIFNDSNNRFNARLRPSLFRVISVSSRYSSNERRLPSRSQGPEVPRVVGFAL